MLALPPLSASAATVYSSDTSVVLSGSNVTLSVLAGSEASSITQSPLSLVVSVDLGKTFTVRYFGNPLPGRLTNDADIDQCRQGSSANGRYVELTVPGPSTITITPNPTPCDNVRLDEAHDYPAMIRFQSFNQDGFYKVGDVANIFWSTMGNKIQSVRLSLSTDSGANFSYSLASGLNNNGTYIWTVPNLPTTKARLKIEGLSAGNYVESLDWSTKDFEIRGTAIADPMPPATDYAKDTSATGIYERSKVLEMNPSIEIDKSLPLAINPTCAAGSLVKSAEYAAVYYCGRDGKRYVFPNLASYKAWYPDFADVKTVPLSELSKLPIGGNVTYRPGYRLVKVQTDPKVYAVARNGVLRHVTSELIASSLFGPNWKTFVDDIPDAFFVNYTVGAPLSN